MTAKQWERIKRFHAEDLLSMYRHYYPSAWTLLEGLEKQRKAKRK